MKLVKYLDCIEDRKVWDILRLFIGGSDGLTGRKVSQILGMNHKTCTRYLESLYGADVLSREVVGRAYIYTLKTNYLVTKVLTPLLNQENQFFETLKVKLAQIFQPYCTDLVLIGDYAEENCDDQSVLEFCVVHSAQEDVLSKKVSSITKKLESEYGVQTLFHLIASADLDSHQALLEKMHDHGRWLVGEASKFRGQAHTVDVADA